MAASEEKPESTRERLLESACRIFADKGYRDATLAEICETAGANSAAVNYYFRDKASLYAEAWRQAFQQSLELHPPDGGVPPDAPVEERFRGSVLSLIKRILDPQSCEFEITRKEMANPTGLLEGVRREAIEPVKKHLGAVVRELMGDKASEVQISLCQMSTIAQCFNPLIHRRRYGTAIEPPHPLSGLDTEAIADHIVRFSLAAIRELRRQVENGEFPCPGGQHTTDREV